MPPIAAAQEQYLQRIEAGEIVTSRPPAGVDQVRLYQARIAREQQRLAQLSTGVGPQKPSSGRAIRRSIRQRPRPG